MTYELLWQPDADRAMTTLESSPNRAHTVTALQRTLGRLELDPFNPKMGTRQFQTPEYGQIRATPTGLDTWYVLWLPGRSDRIIEIVHIVELRL